MKARPGQPRVKRARSLREACLIIALLMASSAVASAATSAAARDKTGAKAQLATVAKWRLDEGEGYFIRDEIAGRNGLVESGGKKADWRGGALWFSGQGAGSRVRVDSGQLIDGETFEIALEVSPSKDWKAGCLLASQPKDGTFGGFRLCYSKATQVLSFEVSNGTHRREYAGFLPSPLLPGRWTTVQVRARAGVLGLIVADRLVKKFAVPGLRLHKSPFPLVIGAGVGKDEPGFRGKLRNVTLRDEVARAPSLRKPLLGYATRGHWPMDEGSGIVVRDLAAEHHGVLEDAPTRTKPAWSDGTLHFAGKPEAGGVMIRHAGPFYGNDFVIDFDVMLEGPSNDWGSLISSKKGSSPKGGFAIDYNGTKPALSIKLSDGKRQQRREVLLPFRLPQREWISFRFRFIHDELKVTIAGIDVGRFDLPGFVLAQAHDPLLVGAYYYPPGKGVRGRYRDLTLRMGEDSIVKSEGSAEAVTGLGSTKEKPCRAKPMRDTMLVGSNVLVPNWLGSTCKRRIRDDARFDYEIDVPQGFELKASGSNRMENGKVTINNVKSLGKLERNGKTYTRYRTKLSYRSTAGGESGFGPLFIATRRGVGETAKGTDKSELPHMSLRFVGGDAPEEAVSVGLRVREFPDLPKAKKLHLSLAWMAMFNSLSWPDFFDEYGKLGFNAVPTLATQDGNLKPRTRRKFLRRARREGFDVVLLDSPYHRLIFHREARTQTSDGSAQPFVDPSYRGRYYEEELERMAAESAKFEPQWFMMDIECFTDGTYACLIGNSPRCVEYLATISGGTPADPSEAMTNIGTELIADIHNAIEEELPGAKRPRMGLNTTEPGRIYHRLFDYDKLHGKALDYAQPILYRESPSRMGARMRRIRAAMPAGDIIPWMDPGTIEEYPSSWVYDRVLEVFGSGGRGIAWFAYSNFEGADFYYLARALEAAIPVEDVIIGSEPMPKIEVAAGAVNATGISNGEHHLLLLSDYKSAQRKREVRLRLPDGVEGTLWDLARKEKLGRVEKNEVTLDWRPGVKRARTALYYVGPSRFEGGRIAVAERPAAASPQ